MGKPGTSRAVWRVVLRAVGLGTLVGVTVLGTGVLLATPRVRHSRFGELAEHNFPRPWSRIALLFGCEQERVQALPPLRGSDPHSLRMLVQAADDRSPRVRSTAVLCVYELALGHVDGAQEALLHLSRHRRRDVRVLARFLLPHIGASPPEPAGRRLRMP